MLTDHMSPKKLVSIKENIETAGNISLLSLPERTLDCILNYLSPIELCRMSEVCTSLRDKCRSDHLWEKHIKQKWGRVIGDVAYKEWQWHMTTAKVEGIQLNQRNNQNGSLGSFGGAWPFLCLGSYLQDCKHLNGSLLNNFMMDLYFALESGRFWFPAQIYRGLYVSNALISYNSKTDDFQARQQHGGWRFLGNFGLDMLRAPPVETPPCVAHVCDCLESLKPGDHIEIQWKPNGESLYDWWYAVIGHLESCDEDCCRCHYSETLMVEFNQYYRGSNERQIIKLSRKNGEQQFDEAGGFYGGIRKLHSEEEIERWKRLTWMENEEHSLTFFGEFMR